METTGEITRAKNSTMRPAPEIFKYIAGPADVEKKVRGHQVLIVSSVSFFVLALAIPGYA